MMSFVLALLVILIPKAQLELTGRRIVKLRMWGAVAVKEIVADVQEGGMSLYTMVR